MAIFPQKLRKNDDITYFKINLLFTRQGILITANTFYVRRSNIFKGMKQSKRKSINNFSSLETLCLNQN